MTTTDKLTDEALEQMAKWPGVLAEMARELLAHRRASQASPAPIYHGDLSILPDTEDKFRDMVCAPAPSDGLREEPCSGTLLEWMTYHDQPLQLWREADENGISEGSWVVVDNHKGTVMGSGPTAEDALREAYTEALSASPAQEGGE